MTPPNPPSNLDVTGVFYDHVFNYMPAHLLHIDRRTGVRLINREDLYQICKPEHVTEEAIALLMAKRPKLSREEAIKDHVVQELKYAILSHRWLSDGEPTFRTVMEKGLDGDDASSSTGCEKLRRFCDAAEALGCKLAWADTCCIDKTSSAELDEAIRSMFRWYRNSAVCIVLLAATYRRENGLPAKDATDDSDTNSDASSDTGSNNGTSSADGIQDDPWFTRGWTLQELLAPARIKFFDSRWSPLSTFVNDKQNSPLMRVVSDITGIDGRNLRYFSPGLLDVRDKMLWASTRRTTRVEDVAYALLGLFDVVMPIAYGEGKRAFRRLMEAIVHDCREWQVFAWAGPHSPYAAAFPESPSGYRALTDATAAALNGSGGHLAHRPWDLRVGCPFYAMTKKGLELDILLVEMMMHIDREPIEPHAERLTFSPGGGAVNRRYFEPVRAVCDTRLFLLFSQWAVGIINYQTDGAGNDQIAELEGGREYVCFLLGTGVYSPNRKWEKVETREVLTIRTKEVLRRPVTTVWL